MEGGDGGGGEKLEEVLKLKKLIKEGVDFVYTPASIPETKMAQMGVPLWPWSRASPRKRSPSSAIT